MLAPHGFFFFKKIILTVTRYKIYNNKLLFIIKFFKTWQYYVKNCKYKTFIFTYYKHLYSFINEKKTWVKNSYNEFNQNLNTFFESIIVKKASIKQRISSINIFCKLLKKKSYFKFKVKISYNVCNILWLNCKISL